MLSTNRVGDREGGHEMAAGAAAGDQDRER